jgi:hypothetical protein
MPDPFFFPVGWQCPVYPHNRELLCPNCQGELGGGDAGHHCEKCGRLYNTCEHYDNVGAELNTISTFVAALLPRQDFESGLYPGMSLCVDRAVVAFFDDVADGGTVVAVNSEPGLKHAAMSEPQSPFDGAQFLWWCPTCNDYDSSYCS